MEIVGLRSQGHSMLDCYKNMQGDRDLGAFGIGYCALFGVAVAGYNVCHVVVALLGLLICHPICKFNWFSPLAYLELLGGFCYVGHCVGRAFGKCFVFLSLEMAQSMTVAARAQVHERTRGALKYFEASITIVVGGVDINMELLDSLRRFIEDHCIVGFCVVERGGALTHKHFQMTVKGNINKLTCFK